MTKDLGLKYVECCGKCVLCYATTGIDPLALSEHQKQSILLRIAKGERPAAVARALGVHRSTVGRVVDQAKSPGKGTKKRGRGDRHVTFRAGSGELDGLDRLVSRGVVRSRSDGFRRMLRVLTGYFDPDPGVDEGLERLLSEVSAIGNNLNQVTREFHKLRRERGLAQISDTHLAEIREARREVQDVKGALLTVLKHREKTTARMISEIEGL